MNTRNECGDKSGHAHIVDSGIHGYWGTGIQEGDCSKRDGDREESSIAIEESCGHRRREDYLITEFDDLCCTYQVCMCRGEAVAGGLPASSRGEAAQKYG
jgi:hypothetical protein